MLWGWGGQQGLVEGNGDGGRSGGTFKARGVMLLDLYTTTLSL